MTPTTDPIVAAITVLEHVTINDPSGRPDTEDAHNRVRLALGYLEIAHKELRVRTAEAILAKSLMTAEQDERYARLRPGAIGVLGAPLMAAWDDRLIRWRHMMKPDVRPNRCPYCGAPCKGKTCGSHVDLARLEAKGQRA